MYRDSTLDYIVMEKPKKYPFQTVYYWQVCFFDVIAQHMYF